MHKNRPNRKSGLPRWSYFATLSNQSSNESFGEEKIHHFQKRTEPNRYYFVNCQIITPHNLHGIKKYIALWKENKHDKWIYIKQIISKAPEISLSITLYREKEERFNNSLSKLLSISLSLTQREEKSENPTFTANESYSELQRGKL